ncbi:MAG: TatD family hydrolase [Pseudomonadota bacterium]
MPPDLVDSHCHLDFPQLRDQLSDVVSRAETSGVRRMVTICTRLKNEPKVRAIAEAYRPVYYAAGAHPLHLSEEPMAAVSDLVRIASHPKCVGIGETGLDYHYTAETAGLQQESLRLHIEASRQTGLPLIIHSRDADDDMARILREEFEAGPYTCVMHCFSSGRGLAETALGLGFYLSMSGIAAFPRSEELRAIFADAPLDRILVETDSPYLAPPPHRGKTCEPAFTALTARKGAETMGVDFGTFCSATTANFDRLFTKAARGAEAA